MNSIHRDVKLINVLMMENGLIKLSDFGLAKKINLEDELGKSTVGTPYYLSPETITFGSFTIKSDVWGLGCLAYELCTGAKPFQGKAFG
jgi:serine/threonine protein kinase